AVRLRFFLLSGSWNSCWCHPRVDLGMADAACIAGLSAAALARSALHRRRTFRPARILRPIRPRRARHAGSGPADVPAGGARILSLRTQSDVCRGGIRDSWTGAAAWERLATGVCRAGLDRVPSVRLAV